jgi:transketolase
MTLEACKRPTRRAFSDRLVEYGARNDEFVVLDSDIGFSTYTCLFGDAFPERYFNMGIAEIGTMSVAAGIANEGRPVVVGGYGVFLTMRALEAVRSFICYPNLNVKIMSSHGGLTAAIDGATHQATEDIAFMSTLPRMRVLVPADPTAAEAMVDISLETPGPFFIRLMRDPLYRLYPDGEKFDVGGSKILREGTDVTILSYGDGVFQALEAAELLAGRGVQAEVIDMYSVKPWDVDAVRASVEKTRACLVAENHQRRNGLGYEVGIWLLKNLPVPFENLGLSDAFGESGDYLSVMEKHGLRGYQIAEAAAELAGRK